MFLEVNVQDLEKLHNLCKDLPHLPERMKIEKLRNLQPGCMIKRNIFYS